MKAATNADVVRDIKISVQPVRRRARIVYFPAYIAHYTFGEYLASNGERKPHRFMAVIGGMSCPGKWSFCTWGKRAVLGRRQPKSLLEEIWPSCVPASLLLGCLAD